MRLVTWNAYDDFTHKFGHLERLDPDIAILQEVRPGCIQRAGLAERAIWTGDEGHKGLAAIGYNGWTLSRAPIEIPEKWFIPVVARKDDQVIHVLAVWADSRSDCGSAILSVLDRVQDFLREAPAILAGDFNHAVWFDRGKGPGRRFADVLSRLQEFGIASAWHGFHGEEHGKETAPTFYHQWNADKRFHIDFVFHCPRLTPKAVTVGSFETYVSAETKISDHVPIVAEFGVSI